jgi:O-antigen ligase
MRIPILSDRAADVTHQLALVLVVALSLITLPAAADPYQPVRALVLGVAGLLVALATSGRGASTVPGRLVVGALAAVAVLSVVSALSAGPASAVFGVHGRFQGLVSGVAALVAILIGLASRRRIRFVVRAVAVAVAVQSAVIAWQALSGSAPTGTLGNQVLAGSWMVVAVAVAAFGARAERGAVRVLLWIVAALGAVAIGVIGSRGAWAGLALATLVLIVVVRTARPRVLVAVAGVAVASLALGIAMGGAQSAAKLDPAALGSGSAAARLQIWRGTAAMVAEHPLLGVGPGRYLYAFAVYEPVEHARLEPEVRPDQAHSVPLQIAAESGVPAALAAVIFTALALAAAARGARVGDGAALIALGGLAAFIGQAIFGISTIETDSLALLCAGVALARPAGPTASRLPRRPVPVSLVAAALSVVLVVASAYYLRADLFHGRGLTAFYAGRMAESWEAESAAVAANPLVDIYRCSLADAAMYGGGPVTAALRSVERGLELEPASYDLALARARLLRSQGTDLDRTADAYAEAVRRYPLGITVAYEAIDAAVRAGRTDQARVMAENLLVAYPDDPVAASLLERIGSGP